MEGVTPSMTTIADFIKVQKNDFHNNLDLGMSYPSYVLWSGFYMPDFPSDGSAVNKKIASEVKEYTQYRVKGEKDITSLLALSLTESEADNCTNITGIINNQLMNSCDTPETFVSAIKSALEKFSERLSVELILAIDTDNIDLSTFALASSLLGSGIFKGIYLYGEILSKMPQKFAGFTKTAQEHNLKTEIFAGFTKSSDEYMNLLRLLNPNTIIQGEHSVKDSKIIKFLKEHSINTVVTPSTSFSTAQIQFEQKARYIRTLLNEGLSVKLATESILLFNQSLSNFASNLCNTGIFSKEEMISLLQQK